MKKSVVILFVTLFSLSLFAISYKNNTYQKLADEYTKKAEIALDAGQYDDAVEYLAEFNGIGPKVAQSICLYGLHMMNSFPVDTHIQQMLKREFDMEYDEWVQWYLSEVDLANDMGYLRQVLFYNELYPVTESNYDWTSEKKKKSLYGKTRKRKNK